MDPTFVPNFTGPVYNGGSIYDLVLNAGTLYVGGDFLANSPSFGAPLDVTTSYSNFPTAQLQAGGLTPFNESVFAAISDGSSGWYVGGNFTKGDNWQQLAGP